VSRSDIPSLDRNIEMSLSTFYENTNDGMSQDDSWGSLCDRKSRLLKGKFPLSAPPGVHNNRNIHYKIVHKWMRFALTGGR